MVMAYNVKRSISETSGVVTTHSDGVMQTAHFGGGIGGNRRKTLTVPTPQKQEVTVLDLLVLYALATQFGGCVWNHLMGGMESLIRGCLWGLGLGRDEDSYVEVSGRIWMLLSGHSLKKGKSYDPLKCLLSTWVYQQCLSQRSLVNKRRKKSSSVGNIDDVIAPPKVANDNEKPQLRTYLSFGEMLKENGLVVEPDEEVQISRSASVADMTGLYDVMTDLLAPLERGLLADYYGFHYDHIRGMCTSDGGKGLTVRQLADKYDLSIGGVHSHLVRTINVIRRYFAEGNHEVFDPITSLGGRKRMAKMLRMFGTVKTDEEVRNFTPSGYVVWRDTTPLGAFKERQIADQMVRLDRRVLEVTPY